MLNAIVAIARCDVRDVRSNVRAMFRVPLACHLLCREGRFTRWPRPAPGRHDPCSKDPCRSKPSPPRSRPYPGTVSGWSGHSSRSSRSCCSWAMRASTSSGGCARSSTPITCAPRRFRMRWETWSSSRRRRASIRTGASSPRLPPSMRCAMRGRRSTGLVPRSRAPSRDCAMPVPRPTTRNRWWISIAASAASHSSRPPRGYGMRPTHTRRSSRLSAKRCRTRCPPQRGRAPLFNRLLAASASSSAR